MNFNNKIKGYLIFLLILFVFSCSTDDNGAQGKDSIQRDAKVEDLDGIWSIYKVESQGVEQDVPINFENCGRDFFIYRDNNLYDEFLFQESSTCLPTKNSFRWSLNNGILTLSTLNTNESQRIEVNNLNKTTFIFSADIDFDGDGTNETYKFTALRYAPPNEIDIYTSSFLRRDEEPFSGHIEFKWDMYNGYNTFLRYEIYRDALGCNINSAELIKTINDVETSYFIDENPLESGSFCYFLKIYTDKGLLGESDPRYVNTEFIIPKNVEISGSSSTDNSITLSWEKYSGYYFSHYEIRVQDQNKNSSPNIETVTIIEDINVTSYTDTNPPYVNNPVYSIYVHNIFGNISPLDRDKNMIQTYFTRSDILNFKSIDFLSFDSEEQSFFIYGRNENNNYQLIKYNYIENKIVAEAFKMPTSYTEVEMKLITTENGKELVFHQGGDLWIYDASNLTFKYSLQLNSSLVNSFAFLKNDIWIASNSDYVITFRRTGSSFMKIDEQLHFPDHQGSMNYEITKLDGNNLLLSHNNEGRSIHFSINANGEITNNGIKQIPLFAKYNSDISVSNNNSLLLNKKRNTLYSTIDFTLIDNYSTPIVTSNFNKIGTKIFGTDNDKSVFNYKSFFKKEIVVYDINDKSVSRLSTKGYPMYLAQDDLGNIVSLSSGFPRGDYFDTNNVPDIFVEIIE